VDVPQVAAIERASYPSPWPEKAFLADVHPDPWAHTLVLFDDDRPEEGVRGYIAFWLLRGELAIHNVAVHPADRRRGAASALLAEAFRQAGRAGCRHAYLEVRPSNAAALSLYRRWGFAEVARRKRYYQDNGEDALVLRADVPREPGSEGSGASEAS
jgi:ribosomal-protein-alanine N-acetyltransferase